jgi:hypothetical protein
LEKACNLTYVNKGEATVIRRKRDGKRSRLEIKRRVKNGLRTSRRRFGLSTESSEGSRASAPQKKVKPALETRVRVRVRVTQLYPPARAVEL